ncbi:OLC1v1037709C2 [Oldenlandia corymbosa var. corymbosa]|nr:OLC1v1037709C2 [Oldenlandia corymbosa var. corymbosa]
MDMCVHILERLEGHRGDLSPSIAHAVLRVAVLASHFHHTMVPCAVLDGHSFDGWKSSVHKLLIHVPKEVSFMSTEIPERLLFWYLDPTILRHDLSQILKEANKRYFLRLRIEFYERIEWRSILICLTLAPAMFIEARALLHSWFLLTGLANVLELQAAMVLLVLDIILRPMWWGLSMETSSKLPFSHAYFPFQQNLIRILAGPLSWENFLPLADKITSHARSDHNRISEPGRANADLVDHYSPWSIAMNFPHWFCFATLLLFYSPNVEGSFQLKYNTGLVESDKLYKEELPYSGSAAKFIAWIVNPATDPYQDLFVDYLVEVSALWTSKRSGTVNLGQASRVYKEACNLKSNSLEGITHVLFDSHKIWLWLNAFQDKYFRCSRSASWFASSSAHTNKGEGSWTSRLVRKIPLGILFGYLSSIDQAGCELLLHYATTGTVFQLRKTQVAGLKPQGSSRAWQESLCKWSETCSIEEAISGARVVFDLTDVIQEMSISLLENEESSREFLRNVKLKVGKFLLKCVNRLLQVDDDEARHHIFGDLHRSLRHWGRQGHDVFQDFKELDDIIMKLDVRK